MHKFTVRLSNKVYSGIHASNAIDAILQATDLYLLANKLTKDSVIPPNFGLIIANKENPNERLYLLT